MITPMKRLPIWMGVAALFLAMSPADVQAETEMASIPIERKEGQEVVNVSELGKDGDSFAVTMGSIEDSFRSLVISGNGHVVELTEQSPFAIVDGIHLPLVTAETPDGIELPQWYEGTIVEEGDFYIPAAFVKEVFSLEEKNNEIIYEREIGVLTEEPEFETRENDGVIEEADRILPQEMEENTDRIQTNDAEEGEEETLQENIVIPEVHEHEPEQAKADAPSTEQEEAEEHIEPQDTSQPKVSGQEEEKETKPSVEPPHVDSSENLEEEQEEMDSSEAEKDDEMGERSLLENLKELDPRIGLKSEESHLIILANNVSQDESLLQEVIEFLSRNKIPYHYEKTEDSFQIFIQSQ